MRWHRYITSLQPHDKPCYETLSRILDTAANTGMAWSETAYMAPDTQSECPVGDKRHYPGGTACPVPAQRTVQPAKRACESVASDNDSYASLGYAVVQPKRARVDKAISESLLDLTAEE